MHQQKAEEKFQEWKKAKDEAEKQASLAATEKKLQEQQEAAKKREVNVLSNCSIDTSFFELARVGWRLTQRLIIKFILE